MNSTSMLSTKDSMKVLLRLGRELSISLVFSIPMTLLRLERSLDSNSSIFWSVLPSKISLEGIKIIQKMLERSLTGNISLQKSAFSSTIHILPWESFNSWEFWLMKKTLSMKLLGKSFMILSHTRTIQFFHRLLKNGVFSYWEDCYPGILNSFTW